MILWRLVDDYLKCWLQIAAKFFSFSIPFLKRRPQRSFDSWSLAKLSRKSDSKNFNPNNHCICWFDVGSTETELWWPKKQENSRKSRKIFFSFLLTVWALKEILCSSTSKASGKLKKQNVKRFLQELLEDWKMNMLAVVTQRKLSFLRESENCFGENSRKFFSHFFFFFFHYQLRWKVFLAQLTPDVSTEDRKVWKS